MAMAAPMTYKVSETGLPAGRMLEACNRLFQRFDRIPDLLELAVKTASEVVDAEFAAIYWQNEEKRVQVFFSESPLVPAKQHKLHALLSDLFAGQVQPEGKMVAPQRPAPMARHASAIIRLQGRIVGMVYAEFPGMVHEEIVSQHEILTQFTALLGHAIEFYQTRQLLTSRYAAFALCQNEPQIDSRSSLESHILAAVQNPEKVAKIIARSFYKDLRRAGFETRQILVVASELIENLNAAFKRTQQKTCGQS
ncbi:MAG: hypothetical protein Q9P90_14345 [candidate division KSB1 bacterium]|nr:hypothetical protein [candidate division KSB1 bacterium]